MRLFPVRVESSPGNRASAWKTALVDAEFPNTPGRIRVWAAKPGREPYVAAEGEGLLRPGDRNGQWFIDWTAHPAVDSRAATPDADSLTWQIVAESGCGCSHPLKRFTPTPFTAKADA